MTPLTSLSFKDVREAAATLSRTKVQRTPICTSETLSHTVSSVVAGHVSPKIPDVRLYFKCENLQTTGSFKFRGATHFINKLSDEELTHGIIAYSTGNHAQAVASAAQTTSLARNLFIPTTVIMPVSAPQTKIDAARSYGVNVILHGASITESGILAAELQRTTGATLVPPSGHSNIVLGQATAMLEFIQQIYEQDGVSLDAVIVPSGGGGLLAGAAIACRGLKTKVIGTEPAVGGANLARGRREGKRFMTIDSDSSTIADGMRSVVAESNWEVVSDKTYVHEVYTAEEDDIRKALRLIIEETKMLIEPSAAVPLATVLSNKELHEDLASFGSELKIGIFLSGGNTSIDFLQKVLD